MIINFSVQNFGSIREKQTLSFEAEKSKHLENHYVIHTKGGQRLLKLALIYGANASGKTTVLKALNFLRRLALFPAEKKTDELNFDPFLFDPKTPKQNTFLSIEFIQNDVKYFYEVELSKKAIINENLYFFNPNKAIVYKRTSDLNNQYAEITFGSKIKKDKTLEKAITVNTLWNSTVLGGFLKTNIEQKELKDVSAWFDDYLHPLVETGTKLHKFVSTNIEKANVKKEDIINILKRADFNISNLAIKKIKEMPDDVRKVFKAMEFTDEQIEGFLENPPREISFEHSVNGKSYTLPFELESEGTKRYFEFAGLLCMLIKGSMALPIDELEASLHPELYLHFILSFLLNSNKSQLIATTHNREILNDKDVFRNDAIWFTDKSETCATELYSLSDFDSSVIRDTSNIYNAYKSGRLKAIPNLADYYIELN